MPRGGTVGEGEGRFLQIWSQAEAWALISPEKPAGPKASSLSGTRSTTSVER